jgi:hypothetical protein
VNIIGIDPGKKGAIVLVGSKGEVFGINMMPVNGKEIDMVMLHSVIYNYKKFGEAHGGIICMVEKLNSFGMGRQSAFNFGKTCGIIEAMVIANDIPLHRVTPQQWHKVILQGIPKQDNPKLRVEQCCKEQHNNIFGDIKAKYKREALRDAFLIAKYGQKVDSNQ